MRVGFYVSNLVPEAGGTFAFERTVISQLAAEKCDHEFVFFTYREEQYFSTTNHKIVSLKTRSRLHNLVLDLSRAILGPITKRSQKLYGVFSWLGLVGRGTVLEEAAIREKVDFMWFLGGYEETSLPFAMTIFDLQHRNQPEFPEVRVDGWRWEEREEFYRNSLRKSSFIVVGTEEGREEVVRAYGVNPKRVHVIPLPLTRRACEVDEARPTGLESIKESGFIFYPSQFWPHKNHIAILLAVKKIQTEKKLNIPVVFCGSDMGNRDYIYRQIRELGLESQVYLLHYVSDSELRWLYRHALALVFPTFFGPDNLPPLEAFALGCPVIASDVAGASEQLGDAALRFNPESEGELSDLILKLCSAPEIRDELIVKGKKVASQRTSESYVKKILEVLNFAALLRRAWASPKFRSFASTATFLGEL